MLFRRRVRATWNARPVGQVAHHDTLAPTQTHDEDRMHMVPLSMDSIAVVFRKIPPAHVWDATTLIVSLLRHANRSERGSAHILTFRNMATATSPRADDSANLRRRAVEHDRRSQKARVSNTIAQHPDCLDHIDKLLADLGYYDRSSANDLPKSKHAVAMAERKAKGAQQREEAAKSAEAQPDAIPKKVRCLQDFTVPQLMKSVVHPLDASVYSLPNLHAASQKAGRCGSKTLLLNMIEHYSGADGSFQIPDGVDTYTQLVALLRFMHGEVHAKGVAFLTKMPPQYDDDGHYALEWTSATLDGTTHAHHPHVCLKSNRNALLPLRLEDLPAHYGPGSLSLSHNFSLQKALIVSNIRSVSFSFRCVRLFDVPEPAVLVGKYLRQVLAIEDRPGARRLAIEDGASTPQQKQRVQDVRSPSPQEHAARRASGPSDDGQGRRACHESQDIDARDSHLLEAGTPKALSPRCEPEVVASEGPTRDSAESGSLTLAIEDQAHDVAHEEKAAGPKSMAVIDEAFLCPPTP